MSERSYGAKYDCNLSTTQVAERVRADIKAAIKAGELSTMKVSVRTSYYSGGSSLYVTVRSVKGGIDIYNTERLIHDRDYPYEFCNLPWMSADASAILATLTDIVRAYNHDGSDIQSDHFDVKFYEHVGFDHALERDSRERQLAALAAAEVAALVAEMAPVANDTMSDEDDARFERMNAAERAELARDARFDACPAAWAHEPGQGCCLFH